MRVVSLGLSLMFSSLLYLLIVLNNVILFGLECSFRGIVLTEFQKLIL